MRSTRWPRNTTRGVAKFDAPAFGASSIHAPIGITPDRDVVTQPISIGSTIASGLGEFDPGVGVAAAVFVETIVDPGQRTRSEPVRHEVDVPVNDTTGPPQPAMRQGVRRCHTVESEHDIGPGEHHRRDGIDDVRQRWTVRASRHVGHRDAVRNRLDAVLRRFFEEQRMDDRDDTPSAVFDQVAAEWLARPVAIAVRHNRERRSLDSHGRAVLIAAAPRLTARSR